MRIVEEGNKVQVIKELKELIEQKERFLSGKHLVGITHTHTHTHRTNASDLCHRLRSALE